MMENLRLVKVEVNSSNNITLEFTHKLSKGIEVDNIKIYSTLNSVPDSNVLEIKQKDNFVFVICQPLTPFVQYNVTALKSLSYPFLSENGAALLLQDTISNVFKIFGPIEKENLFKSLIKESLKDNVYDLDNQSSIPSTIINSLSIYLDKAFEDIKTIKNENYISFDVVDEIKIRGSGPFDKLDEGSAYEMIRVSPHKSNFTLNKTLTFDTSKYTLFSLQEEENLEIVYPDLIEGKSIFNINTFIMTLTKGPITKVKSIKFTLTSLNTVYTYDLSKYGYQIKDDKYDTILSKSLLSLNDNQIKLNEEILFDEDFDITQIVKIDVVFYAKNLGKIISSEIEVFEIKQSIREVLPPIINVFNLKYFPIVTNSGESIESGGLSLFNINSKTRSEHPAFSKEIKFRYENLPSLPGEFTVDYSTGKVIVYGDSIKNDGTGATPPLVTYYYKFYFDNEIDYVFDEKTYDIAFLPKGKCINKQINISFTYEYVYVKNKDYKCSLHEESLNERIDNKLLALNCVSVNNYPITNVYRIYNETSGELYTLNRFTEDKIYFKYNTPPNILNKISKPNFAIFSEKLNPFGFVLNASNTKIAKIKLSKNQIINNSNDGIANFRNTSLSFDSDLFVNEKSFVSTTSLADNINKLSVGDYCVNYSESIIYLAITNETEFGNATYNYGTLELDDHILYANNVGFYFDKIESQIEVESIEDKKINLKNIPNSIEGNLQFYNNKIGYFDNSSFITKVKDRIYFLYGLYEYNDFCNSTNPINFGQFASFTDKTITTSNFSKKIYSNVEYNLDDGYFLNIEKEIYYESPSITYMFSAKYVNGNDINVLYYTIESNTNKIILDTNNLGLVELTLNFSINNFSNVIVDYSKGIIKSDYNYLADEILVSYEYGLNSLDFRQSQVISEGDQYYVSYRVGALRDALARNFSNLINIEELSTLDTFFNRERYRDAIYAALSSFIQGPTTQAIENIVKSIVHTKPEIIESIFTSWTLGESLLTPNDIKSSFSKFAQSKYDNGILIDSDNQSIEISSASNFNVEDGSLQFWIKPQWDGIDNDSTLSFEILDNNISIDTSKVFIGASEDHPSSNTFDVSKSSITFGTPNLNKDGVFIYLDKDESNLYNRWYLFVSDGYSGEYSNGLNIKISGNEFYDFKIVDGYDASTITTTNKQIKIKTKEPQFSELYSFVCDSNKYFIDIKKDKSRFSIYKDKSGYLNFSVTDVNGKISKISHDVSSWLSDEDHHIAVSWKLNSKIQRDEMHLFVDGTEVSNVLNYSSLINNYPRQDFRTVSKEFFIGIVDKDILSGKDLEITQGSNIVESITNFNSYDIDIGDIIYINDSLINDSFTITNVSGQQLELSSAMPITLSNVNFTINKTNKSINGRYYINNNNYIYKISSYFDGYDLSTIDGYSTVSSLQNFEDICNVGDLIVINNNQYDLYYTIISVNLNELELDANMPATNSSLTYFLYKPSNRKELISPRNEFPDYNLSKNTITLLNNVYSNDIIFAESLGLNHEVIKGKYYHWSDSITNIIKTQLSKPVNLDEVEIYKVILDSFIVKSSNSTLTGNYFESNNITCDNPISSQSGRELNVILSGTNLDFSSPVFVEVTGNVNYATVTETVQFTDYGAASTSNKFFEVYNIKVKGNVIYTNKNFCSIKCIEKENIFTPQVSYYTPKLNYSYIVNNGIYLEKESNNTVTDKNNKFSNKNVNDYLLISEPINVAGFYKIISVSEDLKSLQIESLSTAYTLPLPDFTDGYYQILNSVGNSSGIQNGFFNFEPLDYPGQQYMLRKGFYEFIYPTYLKLKFDLGDTIYFGSNYLKQNQCNSILSNLVVYNTALSDVRAGESITDNNSITKDFNSIKGVNKNKNILFLCRFNEYPFKNEADYYVSKKNKSIIYSNTSVNDNFNNSVYLNNKNIVVENNGYLDSKHEGTIEFWINPIYDTINDYKERYYFDASSLTVENVVSKTNIQVFVSGNPDEVISVKMPGSNINYFSGGRIDFVKSNAKLVETTSINKNKLTITEEAKEILTVNLVNDYAKVDYFNNGSISSDGKIIYLNKDLPSNNSNVLVTFIPKHSTSIKEKVIILGKQLPAHNVNVEVVYADKGTNKERISIFKDKDNYLNLFIYTKGSSNWVRAPIAWESNSWHKIKASYKVNSSEDNILLFVDGYQYNSVVFNDTITYSEATYTYGSVYVGDGYGIQNSITLKDSFNYFVIGSDYQNNNFGNCIVDNFRISNKFLDAVTYKNEPIDVTYDLPESAIPLTKDLYTTYLLDFDISYELFNNFAKLINKDSSFEFDVNIFDSFEILKDNPRSKTILEKLIKTLKPANSKVFINYA